MKIISLGILSILLSSCVRDRPALRVDDFKMRGADLATKEAAMVRGDQKYILFGKISTEEQVNTIGHYLLVRRGNDELPGSIRVLYQQVKTGSEKLERRALLKEGEDTYQFKVVGKDYKENGRVLAWKVELYDENEKFITSEQSYLWRESN